MQMVVRENCKLADIVKSLLYLTFRLGWAGLRGSGFLDFKVRPVYPNLFFLIPKYFYILSC
jgi:hypothetical protein